ncbi:hypothetical protein, partial [Vibrio nigripulchritudo]|uniref:hypothetical protein n=1 Tax=Vibrio nigripulchritudo TaxID=28173 RepID=UPI000AAA3EF3
RTPDPLVPNQMRYQAALFTDCSWRFHSQGSDPLVPLFLRAGDALPSHAIHRKSQGFASRRMRIIRFLTADASDFPNKSQLIDCLVR